MSPATAFCRAAASAALSLSIVTLAGGNPARATCHDGLLPFSSLEFRRELQADLRGLGITGFGRTQPYRDSTVSLFLGSDLSLIVREQDSLAIEIGTFLPLPAEPLEIARQNALVAHVASRLSKEDERVLRARLLERLEANQTPGSWLEQSELMRLDYQRTPQALIVKIRKQICN